MAATTTSCSHHAIRPSCRRRPPSSPLFSRHISFPNRRPHLGFSDLNGWGLCSISGAIDGGKRVKALPSSSSSSSSSSSPSPSPWDDKPYEVMPSGERAYLDEEDIVAFLDPPKDLIPFDPTSFNPAAYLWKKIEDVPEERRYRLLNLLKPRLISRAWEIAGTRYEEPKLMKKSAASLLSNGDGATLLEFWSCRTSGGPVPLAWINFFKKAIFRCKDGMTYGRLMGGPIISDFANSLWPLYFAVRQLNEVMSTEQPCDFAYEFGDGFLDIHEYPPGFPAPAKHPRPFNDQIVIYVRHLGPGVMVGQAWQEGEALEKLPQKLCGEILMVKDYPAFSESE